MNATLLVLAAGMGSRYGGLKQLDPMGPTDETLLDYSVFDAVRAGFNRIVFVIRRDFEAQFRQEVGARFENRIDVGYVFQDIKALPKKFQAPATREKPWGTGHAIWTARTAISTSFAAINADDFYGRDAFRVIAEFFRRNGGHDTPEGREEFAMVAYRLDQTLSEHGTVSRGVCAVDQRGSLRTVDEITNIAWSASGGATYVRNDGSVVTLAGNEAVSLNFWGFTPAVFRLLEEGFAKFLSNHAQEAKAEYYIPSAVSEMIAEGQAQVQVLPTDSTWFGVTYREDKALVTAFLAELTRAGEYPARLWA